MDIHALSRMIRLYLRASWYTQAYSLWGKEDYLLITRYVRVFQHIAYSIQLDFLPSKGALSSNDIVGLIYRRNYSRKDYLFTLWPLKVLPMRLVLDWVGSRCGGGWLAGVHPPASHSHGVSGGVIRSFLRALRLSVFCTLVSFCMFFFI